MTSSLPSMRKLVLALVLGVAGPALAQPVTSRIVGYETRADSTTLTIAAGADQGVARDWKAYLVDDKGNKVEGGELTVIRVDKRVTMARTEKRMSEIKSLRVRLEP